MIPVDLRRIAQRQLADYDRHRPGTTFADGLSLSVADAYRVQSLVADLRVQRGEHIIGYKVGCTSPVVRRRLGAQHPVFARLFDTESWPSETTLSARQFDSLAIEGELAVRLQDDLPDCDHSDAEIINAIGSVFPVIELHNLVFRGGAPSVEELITGNAIHAGFVRGDDDSHQFESNSAMLQIDINDVEVATVRGPDLPRTIVESLSWLNTELRRHNQHLRNGQIVLCGSVADLFPLSGGCRIAVTTDRFGHVACTIDDSA